MAKLIIGLKVESYKSFADCVKVIRQFENYSLAEIKTRIQNHDYVLCYECSDDVGVKKIIRCYEQLTKLNVVTSLYELDNRLTTIENVRNRDTMYNEISDEIDAEDSGEN